MKKIVILGIALLTFTYSFSQNSKDPVLNYIASYKEYVALTDTVHLPSAIKPYYNIILNYMNSINMDKNKYFINKNNYHLTIEYLTFPMFHYHGFELKYKEQKNKKAGDKMVEFIGNASGKDGNIKIDIKNKKVISFIGWK